MGAIIRVGILTVSDRCSRGEMEDRSGPAIAAALPPEAYSVDVTTIVPDERAAISNTLRAWSDGNLCEILLTTGGTGFAARDVTPEATRAVIEREAANLIQYLLIEGLKHTPMAALSRAAAGIRGATLIVNLPGSPKGARESVESLLPLLPHAVDVLAGSVTGHPTVAENINHHEEAKIR